MNVFLGSFYIGIDIGANQLSLINLYSKREVGSSISRFIFASPVYFCLTSHHPPCIGLFSPHLSTPNPIGFFSRTLKNQIQLKGEFMFDACSGSCWFNSFTKILVNNRKLRIQKSHHRKSTARGEADSWVHGSHKEVPPYYAENNYSST